MNAKWTWSGKEFEQGSGKRIRFEQDGVALRRGVTVADELGKCNDRDREDIACLRVARKRFLLDRLAGDTARICPYLECDRAGGKLEVLINGHTLTHVWADDRPYWTERWTPLDVPVSWLREGENEVVFRSKDDSVWGLLIESSRQPDRSDVSEDGGKTWRSEDLGWNNGCDGEYMVRLWLDQFPPRAAFESEVIDLCRDSDRDVAVQGRPSVIFDVESTTPAGTAVNLSVRAGSTPAYDPTAWSAWEDTATFRPGDGRFAQWRLELVSHDPSQTPTVHRVTVESLVESEAHTAVVHRSEGSLRRSTYRFSHARHDDPRSERLRDRWHLDEVVRGASTEWEAYLCLRQWVRDQWEDGWDMGEIEFCPPWDAMLILELTSRNLSLGMCTHYATVMSQCCAALGLNARTQIMRSHCINEVWSTDHQKWVAMDVGGDNDDETKFVYHFEREGVPLSAAECHDAWVSKSYDDVNVTPQPPPATRGRYEVDKRLKLFERFMISLRSDELRSLEPGEAEHGRGSYHYDGYLFWEDDQTKALPWFSHHTERRDDLYWSVNETYIHLRETSTSDELEVLLESDTPNLESFQISFDGETWEPEEQSFVWVPDEERSRLRVRSVNHHGRFGVESVIEVRSDD